MYKIKVNAKEGVHPSTQFDGTYSEGKGFEVLQQACTHHNLTCPATLTAGTIGTADDLYNIVITKTKK